MRRRPMAERTTTRLRNGMTPSEAEMAGRLGAHLSWGRTVDRRARTAPAREAWAARFVADVRREHPDLDDDQVEQMAAHRRQAEMSRVALASVRARRRKRAAAVPAATALEADQHDRSTPTPRE